MPVFGTSPGVHQPARRSLFNGRLCASFGRGAPAPKSGASARFRHSRRGEAEVWTGVQSGPLIAGGSPKHEPGGATRTTARRDPVPRRSARPPHCLHGFGSSPFPRSPPPEPLAATGVQDLSSGEDGPARAFPFQVLGWRPGRSARRLQPGGDPLEGTGCRFGGFHAFHEERDLASHETRLAARVQLHSSGAEVVGFGQYRGDWWAVAEDCS
jgi:hypothetical protein